METVDADDLLAHRPNFERRRMSIGNAIGDSDRIGRPSVVSIGSVDTRRDARSRLDRSIRHRTARTGTCRTSVYSQVAIYSHRYSPISCLLTRHFNHRQKPLSKRQQSISVCLARGGEDERNHRVRRKSKRRQRMRERRSTSRRFHFHLRQRSASFVRSHACV